MKKNRVFYSAIILILSSLLITQQSCNKDDELSDEPQYLSVDFPRLTHKHDLYYQLEHNERSIEMEFSQPIDKGTVEGNISFSDKSGALNSHYNLVISGRKVLVTFHSDFQLHDGWKYLLSITTGLKSTSGENLKQSETLELRTTTKLTLSGSTQRNSIACISDIHLGDSRAESGNYCWFGKNANALESFLDDIQNSDQVRVLVILGDLFDEWLVPYSVSPIDPQAGINNTKEYFLAIAGSPTNSQIFDKLRAIALNEEIELVYVPGNHDMLMTQGYWRKSYPGSPGKGMVPVLGYIPLLTTSSWNMVIVMIFSIVRNHWLSQDTDFRPVILCQDFMHRG